MTLALADTTRGAVLADLCTALRNMTVAGGYHWNVQRESVQTDAVNVLGIESERRPFFHVQASPDGSREYEPANQFHERFRVLVTAIADAEDGVAPDRKHAAAEALIGDIEQAVSADITRGARCSDTRVLVPEILIGTGTDRTVVVVQELECRIHRTYGAP